MKRSKTLGLAVLLLAIVIVSLIVAESFLSNPPLPGMPRALMVGDAWIYRVTYPDGENFMVNETVTNLTELNGTEVYVLLRDDVEHISTEYQWITTDWREIQTFEPHIGNLDANATVTYSPAIELFQAPLSVGAKWLVDSNVTTLTKIRGERMQSVGQLHEAREVNAIEEVSTPAGVFRSFKVTVEANGSLSEVVWFDPALGQIVSGDYYNGLEKVTQTLVWYSESPAISSDMFALCAAGAPTLGTLRKLYLQQNTHFMPS
jgi:hypothetical protein